MGNYACINNLDLIDSYCNTASITAPEASCPVADPVYPATGVTTLTEADFISGGDTPMMFKRTYRSAPFVRTDAGFGPMWFHSWQRQLGLGNARSSSPQVVAYREDGSKVTFVKTGGAWVTADGTLLALTESGTRWTVIDRVTDTSETYSTQGVLLSVSTHDLRVTTLIYSDANTPANIAPAPGLLIAATEHAANSIADFDLTLRFSYDAKYRLTQMTDPTGGVSRYAYDTHDNLVSVAWPDGNVRRFVYENTAFWSLLTGVIDETGSRIATWTYDSKGRAIAVSHPDTTRNVQFSYGTGTTTVTDSQRSTTLNFSAVAGVQRPTGSSSPSGATSTTWSAMGNLLTDTAADGSNTEYSYDAGGRPVRSSRSNPSGTVITSVRYADATSLRPSMMATPGMMRAFVYDNLGNLTGVSELTTHDVTGAQGFDASTANGQQRTYGMTYDSANHLKTQQVYVNGVMTEDWHLTWDGTANSRIWSEYKSGRGNMVSLRDAAHRPIEISGTGFIAWVTYDARGRIGTFIYDEAASPLNGDLRRRLTVKYGYAPDGRVVSRTGTVATNGGADTPIGQDEIGQWLDNYESGVTPAGPRANLLGAVKALQFVQEPGLEPVCFECALAPVRWVAGAVNWGMSFFGKGGSQCKSTQATTDELMAAANEPHVAGQLISKAGRAATKHPDYFGFKSAEDLRQVYRTNEQLNDFASNQLKDILESGVRTEGPGPANGSGWVTYTRSDGVAASWRQDGGFIGFRGVNR
jgi:YD repeat-containing protein